MTVACIVVTFTLLVCACLALVLAGALGSGYVRITLGATATPPLTATPTSTDTPTPTVTAPPTATLPPTTIPTRTITRFPTTLPTRAPTPSPTPTFLLTPTGVTFKFDDSVAQSERDLIQNGVALGRRSFGDVGPVTVFAYTDLNTLITEMARNNRLSIESDRSKDLRRRFENYTWSAAASSGAIWLWVSDRWKTRPREAKTRALIHEYFHLAQDARAGRVGSKGPLWLIEGAAEFESYRVMANLGQAHLSQARSDKIIQTRGLLNSLSSMEQLTTAEVEDTGAPYSLGYLAVERLIADYGGERALLQFWDEQSKGATWQSAFQSAFGISLSNFYAKFEAYRREQFPPYCGAVQTARATVSPTPTAPSIRFDRRHPPGALALSGDPLSASPNIPYTFCVSGFPLTALTEDQKRTSYKTPTGVQTWHSCGGNCIILYMHPSASPGEYTFSIELSDGRRAETVFQHGNNSSTVTPRP